MNIFSVLLYVNFCYFAFSMTTETKDGITLHYANIDSLVPEANLKAYVDTFFIVCSEILAEFNPNGRTYWNLTIDPAYSGAGAVLAGNITVGASWSKAHPSDVDVVTWCVARSVIPDAYSPDNSDSRPTWITNNMFEYSRFVLGVNNAAANWTLGEFDPIKQTNYTIGGKATSRFLVWLENHYPGIIQKVHQTFVNSDYTDSFWMTETNQTINNLWSVYTKNPAITRPPMNSNINERNASNETISSSTTASTNSSTNSNLQVERIDTIETLTERLFSEASDVWSFGILMWEIFTNGKIPYGALDGNDILNYLTEGNRLEVPESVTDEFKSLMQSCWKEEREERPTFAQIKNKMELYLEKQTINYGYIVCEE